MSSAAVRTDRTVVDLFAERVLATPDAVALRTDAAEVSFAELDARADRVARLLVDAGARPERIVAVALPRSVDMIVALVAVLKSGAAYLPLDPTYPAERVAFMLTDAAPAVVLTSRAADPAGGDGIPRLFLADVPDTVRGTGPELAPLPANPAYVIYTSGSTGTPKGVLMPGACLVNLLAWHAAIMPAEVGTRTAQVSAIGFDVSLHEMLATLVFGRCLVIPAERVRRDPVALVRWLDEHRVRQVFAPNVLIESICDAADAQGLALDSLTDIVQSGEQLTIRGRVAAFLRANPDRRLRNHYGSAEMQDVTTWTADAHTPARSTPAPIGTPLWNTAVRLLDERLRPVADGVEADLYIAGAGLARGYLRRPALTATRFVADPFGQPGTRMYRTGDVARRTPAGDLELVGRADNQVKVHGFRVELGEVEARLAALPGVARAAVAVRATDSGHRLLVGYAVPVAGVALAEAEVLAGLAAALPAHMVPAAVVVVASLPVTPSGKVDLRALPDPVLDGEGAPPVTPEERAIVDIFAAVLGVARVGATDGFVRLGGDSVGVLRVVVECARAGLVLTARQVFELATPRRLAEAAGRGGAGTPRAPGPLIALSGAQLAGVQDAVPDVEEILPTTPVQRGLLFHSLQGHTDVYVEQVSLTVCGALDAEVLDQAVREVVDRHTVLRVGIRFAGLPAPVMVVAPARETPLRVRDLRALGQGAVAEARAEAARDRLRGFDLTRPPLVRFQLFRLTSDEHRLVLTYHHAVLDGWSVSVLLRELLTRCVGVPLPPAPAYAEQLPALG
ncbi:amino acid adenylation domain-containing protein, partial [Actinophytocola sediminis]